MSIDKEDLINFLVKSHSIDEIKHRYKDVPPDDVYNLIDELVNEEKIRYVEGRNEVKYQTVNNDFEGKIIDTIALLAGYYCTNPTCRQFTIAPSRLIEDKIIKIGEAAHIHSSRKKGPRYDEEKSRPTHKNGIWLCRTCHKKIDGPDWESYPPELLRSWKEIHSNWLRENLGIPFNLIKIKKLSLSFTKWRNNLKRDIKIIYKVKSFMSKYEELLKEYLEGEKPTLKSIRIIGPRGVGKKTILIDALEQFFKEKLEKTLVFIHQNNEILNLEFSDDMTIIIQECSNNFHENLYHKLDAFGYVNTILISMGSDNYKAGIIRTHTKLIEVEEFDKFQMAKLLMNVYPSLTTQQSNKVIEMSGGIPAIAFDVYSYIREEDITLDEIDESWQHWESRLDQFSRKESFSKEEIKKIMQRFVLIGEIPYYDDPSTRRQYLPYLKSGEIEKVELTMNSLVDYGFFKVRNFSLTLNPPFMSLYLLKEIKKEDILDHIKLLISGKNKGFLSQFLKKIFMLKEEQIQNYVGWALVHELESNWKSLSDPFYTTIVYHLSDFLPDEVLNLIEKLLSNIATQQDLDYNILIVKTLEKLTERSDFFFRAFNLLIKLALVIKPNELTLVISRNFLNGKVDFNSKIDFLRNKVELNNESESYLIIELLCSLIFSYSIEPHQISQYYGPEGSKHEIEIEYLYIDSILKFIELFLKSPIDKIKKHLFSLISKNVLTLLANGKWEWLKTFFERILKEFPDLKLKILRSIKHGVRLKNLVTENFFNQIAEWVEKLKEEFNIEEKIRWFFDINRQVSESKPLQRDDIKKFAQKFIDNDSLFKESLPYLITSDIFEIADFGVIIANLDENFTLWPLIEENFIKNIDNSSTFFFNGYTSVIFKRDPSKWEKILSKIENIPSSEPKLFQLIIPKYPFKNYLDKLIELYKKGAFPKERINSLYIASKDRLKLFSPEELAKLIKFYFNEVQNKLDGVNLFFLERLLEAQEYVVPNEVEDFIIEILTAFEDLDDFNAYLPILWNELIEKISDQNPNFNTKLKQIILNNLSSIPIRIIINNIGSQIENWLQKDYEKTIVMLRKVLKIQDIKNYKLINIFNEKRIQLINIEDQISFCKDFPQFIGLIIGFHTSELLTQKKITLFFEKLVFSFPYDFNISKRTCLEIVRAKHKMDPALIKKNIEVLEKLKGEATNESLNFWLMEVIKCLTKKIEYYAEVA